jgi:hypothetical protein
MIDLIGTGLYPVTTLQHLSWKPSKRFKVLSRLFFTALKRGANKMKDPQTACSIGNYLA